MFHYSKRILTKIESNEVLTKKEICYHLDVDDGDDYFVEIMHLFQLCIKNAMQIKLTSQHINNDDDIVLQITEIEARGNAHLCILLRKPNEQEIRKHVIDAYRNIKNQLEQVGTFHQSSNEVEQTDVNN
ncbi:unnamed protein product [Rotaria magnacalcarata]